MHQINDYYCFEQMVIQKVYLYQASKNKRMFAIKLTFNDAGTFLTRIHYCISIYHSNKQFSLSRNCGSKYL